MILDLNGTLQAVLDSGSVAVRAVAGTTKEAVATLGPHVCRALAGRAIGTELLFLAGCIGFGGIAVLMGRKAVKDNDDDLWVPMTFLGALPFVGCLLGFLVGLNAACAAIADPVGYTILRLLNR